MAVDADDRIGEGEPIIATLVAAVYERMEQTTDITPMPRETALNSLQSQSDEPGSRQADGSFGWQPTSDRMARFHFSDPIAVMPLFVFSDAFVAIDPETPANLAGRSVCLPIGMAPPDDIRRLIDTGAVRQQPANDLATCAQLVHDGRTDFFVAGKQEGTAAIDAVGLAEEFHIATGNPVGLETLHLVMPRSDPNGRDRIADFNQALADLAADGAIDALLADDTLAAVPGE